MFLVDHDVGEVKYGFYNLTGDHNICVKPLYTISG